MNFINVTLSGKAGTDVEIVPRDRSDEPPPPILAAALNSVGTLRVLVPDGYYVVLGGKTTLPLDLRGKNEPVRLAL